MYNSSSVSLYTPDKFYISEENKEEYQRIMKIGETSIKNKTVIICCLLRDVANKIPEIRKKAERTGEMFKEYRILIVENDSSDGTRMKLIKWSKVNPKVIILGCGVNSPSECSIPFAVNKTEGHGVDRRRINKMTHLRNIYLDYIKENLRDYDYTVIWDLDIIGTVYLDGIVNTIGHFKDNKDIDAICAYGIYPWGPLTVYYDTYAHIDEEDKFHINLKTIHDIKKGLSVKYNRGEPLKKVVSCFSGFCIYRIKSILGVNIKYDLSPPDNLECEHVRLNRKLSNVYLNPSMIHLVLLND